MELTDSVVSFSANVMELLWAHWMCEANIGHVKEWKKAEVENHTIIY